MDKQPSTLREDAPPASCVSADLQTVLDAWREATAEWEHSNEALQGEVRRLRAELHCQRSATGTDLQLETLGQIALEAAHHIRASLGPTALHLHLLRRRLLDDATGLDLLQKIESGVTALDAATDDFLQFATVREPTMRTVSLREAVKQVYDSLSAQLFASGIATTIDVPQGVMVLCDHELLCQAIRNLTLHAVDAMPAGGEIVVTSYAGPHGVELEVADSGGGLPDATRRQAFSPRFSGKSSGSGLGLALVERICALHGGDVVAANCPEGGAAFTMRFPRRALKAAA